MVWKGFVKVYRKVENMVVSAIGLSSFALSFFHQPVPSPLYNKASVECIYIFAGERGGDCKQHRTVMCKNAGLYRSLYGSVWFGLVAYKMIYHNSDLTVLKCLNLVRCSGRLRIPSKLYNNNNNVLVLCTHIVYVCSVM